MLADEREADAELDFNLSGLEIGQLTDKYLESIATHLHKMLVTRSNHVDYRPLIQPDVGKFHSCLSSKASRVNMNRTISPILVRLGPLRPFS
jgi:hypothetical protein